MLMKSMVIVAVAWAAVCAHAQTFPTKPLRLVAAFPAGGSSDLIARVVSQRLSDSLGQPVVVDNRPGVAGSLGAEVVAKSPPDGYTLLLGAVANIAMNVHLQKRVGYDPAKDFDAVGGLANAPQMLTVHPGVQARSVKEFVELARRKPDSLSCGSGGVGTPAHLLCVKTNLQFGIKLLHVPYKGTGQSINDLLGGQIHSVYASMPVGIAHVRSGKLRALAMTSDKRSQQAPDLPTFIESGVPGFISESWWGIVGPRGMPRTAVSKLSDAIGRIVAEPEIKERFAGLGIDPFPMTAAEFGAYMRSEIVRYGKLIADAGIPKE